MRGIEQASFLGELLDPLLTVVLRGLTRIVGCQVECSDSDAGMLVIMVLALVVVTVCLGYIYFNERKVKHRRKSKRRRS